MHESCGVCGVYSPGEDVARLTHFALFALQRRGQESASIAIADSKRMQFAGDMGLVSHVFDEETLSGLIGHIAIGHNRYSTRNSSRVANVQSFIVGQGNNAIAIAHNGNIINSEHMYEALVQTASSTESCFIPYNRPWVPGWSRSMASHHELK